MSLVNVSIVGNIVRPPEQKAFSNGNAKTTLIVAINSKTKEKEETDYYKVEAWGRLGNVAHQYLSKGNQVAAAGRLVLERWQDKNGRDRVTPVVKAEQIALPQRRTSSGYQASTPPINPTSGHLEFKPVDGYEALGEEIKYSTGESLPQAPSEMDLESEFATESDNEPEDTDVELACARAGGT